MPGYWAAGVTGEVHPGQNKTEGPFGDHLGYYSLQHPFPVMKLHKVYAKKNAIWPFTVVGRPPQEDTSFGQLIHEIAGTALQQEIPGLKEVHAVDAAGVHHILGTGQLSLAKFLFITADDTARLNTHDIQAYFEYILKRINLARDIHFYTNTTIDTLDYSGESLNSGSKVVLAAYGETVRTLAIDVPNVFQQIRGFENAQLVIPGVLALQTKTFTTYEAAKEEIRQLNDALIEHNSSYLQTLPFIVICDDAGFVAASLHNFLWVCFTRCNPSHDMHGINSFMVNKHWGCNGPLVFDARIKPHHAPAVEKDAATENKINRLFEKGGSLYRTATRY